MAQNSIEKLKSIEIFEGKTVDEVFKTIFDFSIEERNEALETFRKFKGFIKDDGDLFASGEKPQGYLDSAHKATENLIKLVTAAQKIIGEEEEKKETLDADDILDILDREGIAPTRFQQVEPPLPKTKEQKAMSVIEFPEIKKKVE
tara:strand:+ start:1160 stop:1597 length:438 start_codon:yes stop_codon:yes gene_type:complete